MMLKTKNKTNNQDSNDVGQATNTRTEKKENY